MHTDNHDILYAAVMISSAILLHAAYVDQAWDELHSYLGPLTLILPILLGLAGLVVSLAYFLLSSSISFEPKSQNISRLNEPAKKSWLI